MIYRQKAKKAPKHGKAASKTKTNMRDWLRGFVFCLFWYMSIIAGFFLLICPILPLVIISPKRYRRWSDMIIGMWECFPVAMMEIWFGIRVVLTGDEINPFESSMLVINHRTRVDWNFFWMGLFHCCKPNSHNMKYILKAPIMHVPGPGWVMQTCSFIFVYRSWERDKVLLDKMLDYLNESDDLYQILLFPEGTDLTEENIKKSNEYADRHNMERYYYVLHPKTTGFAFLTNKMKAGGQLKAIYDVTVGYPKTMPQNESDLIRGKFPEEIHFHVKRHDSSTIPHQEEELKSWLMNIWQQKERKLQKFYSTGFFTNDEDDDHSRKYSDDEIDLEKSNSKNGTIKYKYSKFFDQDNNANVAPKFETSLSPAEPSDPVFDPESEIYPQTSVGCGNFCRSKNYRPSHLLYLILLFWIGLIVVTVYGLFSNFYFQIWVLTHSLFFTALSFVSNGFHQIAASIYLYRYGRKSCVIKKLE